MPSLHWIGKEKVVNHHQDVPFRVLERSYAFGAEGSDNKIIHGDNLHAIKALLPQYEGRIKCIYIDPPYNTGNEGWVYNDNVNDPKIKKWLGEVVGKEGEDLSRHDKWLCMMYPRLRLLQRLLADDGAIFISVDDNELANLKLICDEIFGSGNFVGQWNWFKSATPPSLSIKIKKNIDYILCYEKKMNNKRYTGIRKSSSSNNSLLNQVNSVSKLVFPANKIETKLKNGIYKKGLYQTKKYTMELLEDTEVKDGFFIKDVILAGKFRWSQMNLLKEMESGTVISIKTKAFSPSYEKCEYGPEVPPSFIDISVNVDTTENAGTQLQAIFDREKVFDYPKPVSLIEYIIHFLCDKNDIILDSFAGSGTTAHAVLNMNKADGGNRKFILVEMEHYAETITAERVRRVIDGYGDVAGTGGGFEFYELGERLLLEDGNLNENVDAGKIYSYVWFTETQLPYVPQDEQYLLGVANNSAYYFYYKRSEVTTLNAAFLRTLKTKADGYLIYADLCTLSEAAIRKNNITFKKIPRDIGRV
jgi:adenine-specific DNA-methyltransferase